MKYLLLIMLLLIPLVNAEVAIQSFDSYPDKIGPGNQVELKITLENSGDNNIENVLVKLDLTNLPFAPLKSSTEKLIDEIGEDDKETIVFNLIALPNANPDIYKIPVKITYNNTVKESLISLEISSKAKLDLILEDSELIKVNDNGKVTIKLVNNGLTQIKFLKISLQESPAYEILYSSTLYIGEVDVDDFETAEFTIIPKLENTLLNFNVNYKDQYNNEINENKNLQLNVYSLEKAKELGLIKGNNYFYFIVPLVIVLFLIYKKLRRRKNVA